jgi:hypothetical protein
MGYYFSESKNNSQKIIKTRKNQKQNFEFNKIDSEWARYEKYFFEQIALSKKSAIVETENTYSNIDLKKLLNADGENYTAKINLLDLVKLSNSRFFLFAEKQNDTANVTIKKYNKAKFQTNVKILDEVEKIINTEKSTIPKTKILETEKQINAKLNEKIKKISALKGVKPCYKIVSVEQIQRIKNAEIECAVFERSDGKLNIVFLKDNEEKINIALRKNSNKNSLIQ